MTKLPRLPHRTNVFEAKYTAEQMRAYGRKVEAETKEACAKICDSMANRYTPLACAKVIRGEFQL